MEIRYANTIEDFLIFNEYHCKHSKAVQANIRFYRWWLGILSFAILFLALQLITHGKYFYQEGIISLSFSTIYIIIYPRTFRSTLRRQVLKLVAEGQNKGTIGEHTLQIEPDGLVEISPFNQSKFLWSGIERVACTDTHAFIYISALVAHVVPRASIVSGNFDEFIKTLKTNLP